MDYLFLVVLWGLWCALHSLLIAPSVSARLQRRLAGNYRFYRLGYNLFALLSLAPVLAYGFSLPGPVLFRWEGILRWVQGLSLLAAGVLFIAAAVRYDLGRFLGIRQIREEKTVCRVLSADCSLDSQGVLGMVRHPWYTAGILLVWSRDLDLTALLTSLVISAYLVVGAFLEERKLAAQFGPQYAAYQRRVSMFLPFKWVRSSLLGCRTGR